LALKHLEPFPAHADDPRRVISIESRLAGAAIVSGNGIKRLLLDQMIRAKRAGTWFKLPKLQRGLYSLAMRLDVKLQSHDLLRALVAVLKNLKETIDRGGLAFARAMRRAWAISEATERWGNAKAREWRNNLEYIRFLAINFENGL